MPLTIHHRPARPDRRYFLHAWLAGGRSWDIAGVPNGKSLDFLFPGDVPDPRRLEFKFRSQDDAGTYWEPDVFVPRLRRSDVSAAWTFEFSARCKLDNPGAATKENSLTLHAVTQSRFRGGWVFAWNPFEPAGPNDYFAETGRDDAMATSHFELPVRPWMRGGFHFKLVAKSRGDGDWEPDRATKVWCPSDGREVWLKSGQVSLRKVPLQLTAAPVSVMYPATLTDPPLLELADGVDDYRETFQPVDSIPAAGDALFRVARYSVRSFPDAVYLLRIRPGPAVSLPFPADPAVPGTPSLLLLGVDDWQGSLPQRQRAVEVSIAVDSADSLGAAPVAVVGVGSVLAHESSPLVKQADGNWLASFNAFAAVPHWLELQGSDGRVETRFDGEANNRRQFVPAAGGSSRYFTAEGVFGLSTAAPVPFADVALDLRRALLKTAFHPAIVEADVFDRWEMPHGATVVPTDRDGLQAGVWFALYAPQAVRAAVLLLDRRAAPGMTVGAFPMKLTDDLRYWWLRLPLGLANHGAEYRFALNDDTEILDPAARAATDAGSLTAKPGEGLNLDDAQRGSWSRVVDVAKLRAAFTGSAYRTPGWESLIVYEMHPRRFTDVNLVGGKVLEPLDQVTAELSPGKYLQALGVTALEFLPVHEFPSDNSWGYNPSLFFAVDSSYGGPEALARTVRAAHDAGKAVILDLVYNHVSDSPLEIVAPDAYISGQTQWGPMVRYNHPAGMEFFRQATLYMWDVFSIDGYRFDSTETIVNGHHKVDSTEYVLAKGPDGNFLFGAGGGWEFLGYLRAALRKAADAASRPWPYACGENDPANWPMTNPQSGVLDGQWNFRLSYALGDSARAGDDKAGDVKGGLDDNQTRGGRYFESVRYGESHDTAGGGNSGANKRIAARPPFGQGLQMAKAVGATALLANGVPMLFMGQESGEDKPFSFDSLKDAILNPQRFAGDPFRAPVLAWFRALLGFRNNSANGMGGDDAQMVRTGRKTAAWTRGWDGRFFVIATFGTPDGRQDTSWLGLPGGAAYKEIFNSSWPAYATESEPERSNGGYEAAIHAGDVVNLPYIGAVVFERR